MEPQRDSNLRLRSTSLPTDILSEGLRITLMNADLSHAGFSGASGLLVELSVGFVESLMSSEKFREIESGDSESLLSRRPILFKHSCLQTGNFSSLTYIAENITTRNTLSEWPEGHLLRRYQLQKCFCNAMTSDATAGTLKHYEGSSKREEGLERSLLSVCLFRQIH